MLRWRWGSVDAETVLRESLILQEETQLKLDLLASTNMTDKVVDEVVAQILGAKSYDALSTRAKGNAETIKRLSVEGVNSDDAMLLKEAEGTAYALLQGVTAYGDHEMVVRGARTADKEPEGLGDAAKIQDSVWFGAAANLRDRAWKVLGDRFLRA